MDGARVLNAAAALEMKASELTTACDAVALCLSKGLAAPIGSVLAGSKDFIDQARKIRQRFGGGLRQAGVIAAPAIIELREMVHRLPVDHEHAERLRRGLEDLGLRVDRGGLLTNIVNVDVSPRGVRADEVAGYLGRQDVKVKICTGSTLRMVTHNDVQEEDVDLVLRKLAAFFG
jgi:threonine aldolase